MTSRRMQNAIGAAVFLLAMCSVLVLTSEQAAAVTPAPAWSIDSNSEPAYFSVAETRDEVRAFAVSATGGTYELSTTGNEEPGALSAPIEWNETTADLQAKLEAMRDIGAGNVQVSGGPGDELGTKPYLVTFVGALSGNGRSLVPEQVLLTGGAHTVKSERALNVNAAAYDHYTITATNVGSQATTGPIAISDQIPARLTVVEAEVREDPSGVSTPCTAAQTVVCEFSEQLPPGAKLVVTVKVAPRLAHSRVCL